MKFPSHFRQQQGIALMEVLVALIVIAFGLLGVIKMQVMAKRYNIDAVQRTHASLYADSIIERMRANRNRDIDLKLYDTVISNIDIGHQTLSQPSVPLCTKTADCKPNELIQRDLWDWQQLMDGISERYPSENYGLKNRAGSGGLFRPTGCISVTDATAPSDGYSVIVTIAWQGLFKSGDSSAFSGITTCGVNSLADNFYHRQLTVRTFIEKSG